MFCVFRGEDTKRSRKATQATMVIVQQQREIGKLNKEILLAIFLKETFLTFEGVLPMCFYLKWANPVNFSFNE